MTFLAERLKYQSKRSTAFIRNMSVLVWGIFWIFLSIVYCKLTDYKSNLRHFIGTDQRKKRMKNEQKKCSSASWCFMSAVFFWNISVFCFPPSSVTRKICSVRPMVIAGLAVQYALVLFLFFYFLVLVHFFRDRVESETILDVWILRSKMMGSQITFWKKTLPSYR